MVEKSDDPLDLEDAVVVPPSEATLRAVARRGRRASGFLQVPAQIMARLELKGVSMPAWCVLCVLQRLEYRAERKGQPLKLTNKALEMVGVPQRRKYRTLDELVAREFVLPYVKSRNASPQVRLNMRLQK